MAFGSSGQFVRFCSSGSVCSSRPVRPVQFVRFVVSFLFPAPSAAGRGMCRPAVSVLALPRGLSAACRCLLQAALLPGRCLTCLRRYFRGVLPACWGTGWGAPCRAALLPGYSSGFGLLSGVEGWSVAPETEQGMPSASTRAPILISSPSGIFSSPCAGVSRSIV